jgi:dolichol-phosphate mannosyltransferase
MTDNMKNESFIIVMPAYNEEGCIDKVVSSWIELVKKYPGSELLVINDGSKDKTQNKLKLLQIKFKELKVINKKNEGHGATIMRGYEEALNSSHEWVFQTDSDNQFSPKDFGKIWKKRNMSGFILGFRQNRNDAPQRIFIAKLIVVFNLFFFATYIKDANIPYRLMKRKYLKRLLNAMPKNLFAPNIFLSILAVKDKQKVCCIPVSHKFRKTGQVSFVKWKLINSCLRGLKELILFRIKLGKMLMQLNEN